MPSRAIDDYFAASQQDAAAAREPAAARRTRLLRQHACRAAAGRGHHVAHAHSATLFTMRYAELRDDASSHSHAMKGDGEGCHVESESCFHVGATVCDALFIADAALQRQIDYDDLMLLLPAADNTPISPPFRCFICDVYWRARLRWMPIAADRRAMRASLTFRALLSAAQKKSRSRHHFCGRQRRRQSSAADAGKCRLPPSRRRIAEERGRKWRSI